MTLPAACGEERTFSSSPLPASEQLSFLDIDDPFNLRAKLEGGSYRDDEPIPRTKAALQAWDSAAAADEDAAVGAAATTPLACRDGNTYSSSSSIHRASLQRGVSSASPGDKENSALLSGCGGVPVRSQPSDHCRTTQQRSVRQGARPLPASRGTGKRLAVVAAERSGSSCSDNGAGRVAAVAADGGQSGIASLAAQHLPHIAPLLHDGVLRGLSSSVWTECAASVVSVRQAAEADRGECRSDAMRAAVLLLADTPGLACTNQALWKAVSEACHGLLLAAPLTLPSSFIRSVVPSLLSKLADKRTSAVASGLLLQLAECSSARLVQRCVTAACDEQGKNARLVEHAILFVASLCSAFSLPALTVQPLLSLARTHSAHPQQSVRAAVCSLLSVVYEQLGASFRLPLLSSVAPSLHASLNAALDEVDALLVSRQPQLAGDGGLRRGRGEDSVLVSVSLDALFPRVDLCAALESDVVSGMQDKQWKARQVAIQQLTATLDRLQHRVTLKDGGALIAGLVPLLSDSNKLLAAQAMGALRQLVCDVGEGMARWRDKLIPSVLAGVLDAKKAVSGQSVCALQEWVRRLGVASVVRPVAKALEAANSSGRVSLLEVLLAHRTEAAEWSELVPVTLDCLCDKSGEVRAAADRMTAALVQHCGYTAVNTALHRMKEAYVLQLQPTVDRHRFAAMGSGSSDGSNPTTNYTHHDNQHSNHKQQLPTHPQQQREQPDSGAAVEQHSNQSVSHSAHNESEKARKANSGKRKSHLPSLHSDNNSHTSANSQRKDASQATAQLPLTVRLQPPPARSQSDDDSASELSGADCHPFLTRLDLAAKQKRLLRDGKRLQNGSFREWSSEEREDTAHSLASLVSPSLLAHMTCGDFTRLLRAVHFFSEQLAAQPEAVHAIADVLLKWLSAMMGEASPKLLMAALAFLSSLVCSYHTHKQQFSEAEMHNVLPFTIERLLGHNVQRVRKDASALLQSLAQYGLFSRAKLIAALLQGVDSKNKRVVAESCDCIGQLWGQPANHTTTAASGTTSDVQLAVWQEMKRGLPQLALLLSSACDPTVRMSALSAIVSAYGAIGEQLWVVLSGHTGKALPEKALSMIEERVKRTRMDASAASSQSQPHSAETSDEASSIHTTLTAATPIKRTAAVQRTPVSVIAAPASISSPLSDSRRTKSRKQSNAPTLSALNSSLASLEAMHNTLATQQQLTSTEPASTATAPALWFNAAATVAAHVHHAAPAELTALIARLASGGAAEQITALVSLSAVLDHTSASDLPPLLLDHVNVIMAAIARTAHSEAVTDSDRLSLLRLSRRVCAIATCVDSVRADLCPDVCHALLSSAAAELQNGGTADETREAANYCVQAMLERRGSMDQLSLLASVLLASLSGSSNSSYLCSLLTPFLLRWSATQRVRGEAAGVDVSSLLSWLHRLLLAVQSFGACERCVVECIDQLIITACDCSGGEQHALALLSQYPANSPLVGRMDALRRHSAERMQPYTTPHMHSTPTRADGRLLQADEVKSAELVRAVTVTAAGLHSPAAHSAAAASIRLDQLLSASSPHPANSSSSSSSIITASSAFAPSGVAVAAGGASVGLSYVDRFHALQQRLRQQGAQSAAIHHTAEFLSSHTAHATNAQPASPPRRGTTGTTLNSHTTTHTSGTTSSVSAILRDAATCHTVSAAGVTDCADLSSGQSHSLSTSSAVASVISRSVAFEEMRRRMRAKQLESDACGSSVPAQHSTAIGPAAGTHEGAVQVSLSALLAASPHDALTTPVNTTAITAAHTLSSGMDTGSSNSSSGSSGSSDSSGTSSRGGSGSIGGTTVSALRARLAAIHAANRMGCAAAPLSLSTAMQTSTATANASFHL